MNYSALPECPLDIDPSSYSCDNPYPNCTNPAGFQFASLWIITQAIASCPTDSRLFDGEPILTLPACKIFTNKWPWTLYPPADIWPRRKAFQREYSQMAELFVNSFIRLTTWKFPLLQLVAVFPRPPLSLLSELFVLVHLLGDPISTINGLLLKLASCQARALFWKREMDVGNMDMLGHLLNPPPSSSAQTRGSHGTPAPSPRPHFFPIPREVLWKSMAAIVDSYDEWGVDIGSAAECFIYDRLTTSKISEKDRAEFLRLCREVAKSLAADRSTKFLPIIVAQCFFIGTIAIAFGRTKSSSSGPNPATYINIEAHSIAFSSLYFWIIPAVIISSIIGVSQTEDSMPSKLKGFREAIHHKFPDWNLDLLSEDLMAERRERRGGIYSWQPNDSREEVKKMIRTRRENRHIPGQGPFDIIWRLVMWIITLRPGSWPFSVAISLYGLLTGIIISWLVPPVGFDCRHVAEILISCTWIVSACLNELPIFPNPALGDDSAAAVCARRRWFVFILWKDILATLSTMGGIIVTQIGVFNRCECYSQWGRTGIMIPPIVGVMKELRSRIDTSYPAIAFVCVGFQLIIVPLLLLRQYGFAIRVFLQRDDERSNSPRWVARFGQSVREIWEEMGEVAKGLEKWIGKVIMKWRRGSVLRHAQKAPDEESRTLNIIYEGKNGAIVEYRKVELDSLGASYRER